MLFKHKHLLEELRANGRKATGQILSMTTMGSGGKAFAGFTPDEDLTTTWFDARMSLRVMPADHSAPFEATVLTRVHTLKWQGSSVPVWYDPNDTSRVVVDYEADVQSSMQGLADLDAKVHRHDQVVDRAWTPVAGHLLPIEVMVTKGKGRLTAKGRVTDLLSQSAGAAIGYVRLAVHDLVPGLDPAWFDTHDYHVDEAYGGVPHNATEADGLDAGLAVAAALVSLLTGRMVRPEVVLTGRLSVTGDLTPVADYGNKVTTAAAAYSQFLVAPTGNQSDLHTIPPRDRHKMELIFAKTPLEALQSALAKHPVKGYAPPA